MIFGNVFIRESKPLPGMRKAASQGQQSNKYYSLTILTDDAENPYDNRGIIKPIKGAKAILEQAIAEGVTIPGETEKGPYEMITIAFEMDDLITIGKKTFLRDIKDIC